METHRLITYHDTLYVPLADAIDFLEAQGFHMELTVPVEVVGNVQEQDGSFFNYKCRPARKGKAFAIVDMAQGRDWAFGIQQYHEMDPKVRPLADYFGVKRYRAEKGEVPQSRIYWTPEFIAGWLDRKKTIGLGVRKTRRTLAKKTPGRKVLPHRIGKAT
ncbi:MAG: hypothetical protein WCQ66_04145 [Sphaerochaetaceae bacterium]